MAEHYLEISRSSGGLPRGLRPAAELAADKPCGTRIRYAGGCRCTACRRANSQYENERRLARARGEANGLVDAGRARQHILHLSSQGIGRDAVSDVTGVARSTIRLISCGARKQIRAQVEKRILAVTVDVAADRAYIDATETWRLVDELLANGYTKTRIASEIAGHYMRALQFKREKITVRNAELTRRAHARLVLAPEAQQRRAQLQVQELRDEGYRADHITRRMQELAESRGWTGQSIGHGRPISAATRFTQREAQLLHAVHVELLSEELA